jgi:hypothetical protein
MNNWISDELVKEMFRQKNTKALEEAGVLFCVSDSFEHCVLIRNHNSWQTDEGWYSSNAQAGKGDTSRPMLNIYGKTAETGFWFPLFIPLKYEVLRLETQGDRYNIITDQEIISGGFAGLELLGFDAMRGFEVTETEIEECFSLIK